MPDSPKTSVLRPCWYDPDLNPTYRKMAEHYDSAIIPARPGKPRDKAKVENAVLVNPSGRPHLVACRRLCVDVSSEAHDGTTRDTTTWQAGALDG